MIQGQKPMRTVMLFLASARIGGATCLARSVPAGMCVKCARKYGYHRSEVTDIGERSSAPTPVIYQVIWRKGVEENGPSIRLAVWVGRQRCAVDWLFPHRPGIPGIADFTLSNLWRMMRI